MNAVIKSPFIPLLFKQKIVVENKKAGYLTTTKLLLHLKSRKSYKVKYMHQLIKLLENKKQHGKRNWDLIISNKGRENKIGKLVMTGDVKDTLTKGDTEYRLEYGEDTFIIKKPFMSGKNYCELKKVTGEHIATHKKQIFFTFKREMELSDVCTDLENGIFLLTLSVIVFIS